MSQQAQQITLKRTRAQLGGVLDDCATTPFFGVYLLRSLSQRNLDDAYIGFTVDPQRRIGQHNAGSDHGGAHKTHRKRPWEMVCIVYGFMDEVSALKFEWAWQHPCESRRLRNPSVILSKRSTLLTKARVLGEMLHANAWRRLPLNLQVFRRDLWDSVLVKVMQTPPDTVPLRFGPLVTLVEDRDEARKRRKREREGGGLVDEDNQQLSQQQTTLTQEHLDALLTALAEDDVDDDDEEAVSDLESVSLAAPQDDTNLDDDLIDALLMSQAVRDSSLADWTCDVCHRTQLTDAPKLVCPKAPGCTFESHVRCLARVFLERESEHGMDDCSVPLLLPHKGECPKCHTALLWGNLVRPLYSAAHVRRGKGRAGTQEVA